MRRNWIVALGLFTAACGPVEIRVDETKGVPSVTGSTEITLGQFTCGQPITSGDKTVTTRAVAGGCEFTFDQSVSLLTAADYEGIPELKGSTNLVQRIELTIKTLTFTDSATNTRLDLNTRVTSATLSVDGQQVADKAALVALPKTVSISGAALTQIKAKVDARQAVSLAVKAVAVLPDSPALPEKLKLDYDAQPALILGPGKIF